MCDARDDEPSAKIASKVCLQCEEDKPLCDFAPQKGGKLGRSSRCRVCLRSNEREKKHARAADVEFRDGCLKPRACDAKNVGLCPSCNMTKKNKSPDLKPTRVKNGKRLAKELSERPDWREKQIIGARAYMGTPEMREAAGERMKRLFDDPAFLARRAQAWRDKLSDHDFRTRHIERALANIELANTPEARQKSESSRQEYWEYYHFEKRMEREAEEWERENQ